MMTVTGLPCTPSRNAMRQPQASRACVNPFNMATPMILQEHAPLLSQQRLDLALEDIPADQARVFPADSAVAADQHRDRDAPDRAEGVLNLVVAEPLEHGIVHLELCDERLQLLQLVIDRDPHELQPLRSVLGLQIHEARNLELARPAPGRPEIDDEYLPLEIAELHVLVLDVLQRETKGRHLAVRLAESPGGRG